MSLKLIEHPVVQHKLSVLRNKETRSREYRLLLAEISALLVYEASRDMNLFTSDEKVYSPASSFYGKYIKTKAALLPILRSGTAMLEPALNVLPEAQVHHIGIFYEKYSDHPVEYYSKLPTECNVDECIILDPVIDTGSTADAAISIVKSWCKNADGFGKSDKKVKFITVCASKAGLDKLRHSHPDVEYYTAAIDETLSSNGSIEPGIGDCGNRLFGP